MTSWRATGACNARCKYCNVDATGKHAPREMTTQEAFHLVDEVKSFGVRWFGIKGGEPLTRPDIFEIVTYAKSKGLKGSRRRVPCSAGASAKATQVSAARAVA